MRELPPTGPIYIGPANAESALGWSWRYTRDFARAHGIEILRPAGKPLIRAADLQRAIEAAAEKATPDAVVLDARAELARRLAG